MSVKDTWVAKKTALAVSPENTLEAISSPAKGGLVDVGAVDGMMCAAGHLSEMGVQNGNKNGQGQIQTSQP